jgi:prolipoprotein diacylglyceryltransferase
VITQPLALGIFTPYAIILSICAALGLLLSKLLNGKDLPHLLDGGLGLVFLSLVGARLSFVLTNLAYYKEHLLEIPQLWLGGLSWPGAILGAVLSVFLIHWIWKEPPGELADSYLPLLGIVTLGVWLVSWGAGISYGPSTNAWFGIPVRDIFGMTEKHWPLPILGGFLSGAWVAGVIFFPLKRQRLAGTRAILGLAGVIAINGLLSFFRVDPAPALLGLRLETWICLLLLTAAGAAYYLLTRQEADRGENEP